MFKKYGFVLKGQNSAIKIFKIDTLQPLVTPVRHQILHFLNKNSEAKHFSKIISFKKIKVLGKYANRRQSSIHITLELFFRKTKNSSFIIITRQVVIDS